MNRKQRIIVAIGLLVAFSQVIRPDRTNPPEDPDATAFAVLGVTPEVARIFQKSCLDCHSNRTQWPWYSNVAPVSWLVIHDVDEGRQHLNLSDWAGLPDYRAQHELEEICEHVRDGAMPLRQYVWIHREARLTDAEKAILCEWANFHRDEIRARLEASGQAIEAGDREDDHR
jgi:hypothetical protein